jgi:hypothetical protein
MPCGWEGFKLQDFAEKTLSQRSKGWTGAERKGLIERDL